MPSRQLRILLISPKGDFLSRGSEFMDFVNNSREMSTILEWWSGAGVGLQTIAACTPGDHEVTIIDENKEGIDFDTPCDIVGITGMTQQAPRAYEIADEFRLRDVHVAMGGIHATCLPEEARGHVDSVFVGEAENTWPVFIHEYQQGKPRPVYDQSDHPAVDMELIPLPRHDLLAKHRYLRVYIQTTRGCPHDCEFCAASKVYGRRYRSKTVDQVVREVVEVRDHWKLATIVFADDNMFANPRFSRELIEALKDLNFPWGAVCDIAVARDEQFLRDLHMSGCRFMLIGLESVSRKSLRGVDVHHWKEGMVDRYPEYIRRIQENGIGVYGAFILGLDHDDRDTVEKTVDFIGENNLAAAQVTLLTPLPGSRLRQRLQKEGRILTDDWRLYTMWNEVIRHKNFSPGELEESLLRAYQGIYNPESYHRRSQYFRRVFEDLVSIA